MADVGKMEDGGGCVIFEIHNPYKICLLICFIFLITCSLGDNSKEK